MVQHSLGVVAGGAVVVVVVGQDGVGVHHAGVVAIERRPLLDERVVELVIAPRPDLAVRADIADVEVYPRLSGLFKKTYFDINFTSLLMNPN